MTKHKRVVVYVPEDKYMKLRAVLLLMGKTVSGWFRELVDKMIKE